MGRIVRLAEERWRIRLRVEAHPVPMRRIEVDRPIQHLGAGGARPAFRLAQQVGAFTGLLPEAEECGGTSADAEIVLPKYCCSRLGSAQRDGAPASKPIVVARERAPESRGLLGNPQRI